MDAYIIDEISVVSSPERSPERAAASRLELLPHPSSRIRPCKSHTFEGHGTFIHSQELDSVYFDLGIVLVSFWTVDLGIVRHHVRPLGTFF